MLYCLGKVGTSSASPRACTLVQASFLNSSDPQPRFSWLVPLELEHKAAVSRQWLFVRNVCDAMRPSTCLRAKLPTLGRSLSIYTKHLGGARKTHESKTAGT